MNIDSLLVSEFARAEAEGKLTIVGAFHQLSAPGFPVRVPDLYISLIIHGHAGDAGTEHRVEIQLIEARRRVLSEFQVPVTMPPGPALPGLPLRLAMVVKVDNVVFPTPGPYAFEVLIDGVYHAGTALYASLPEPQSDRRDPG